MSDDIIKLKNKKNRIFCVSNNKYYDSSREAAADLGMSPTNISHHLQGHRPHAGGYVFVRAPELLTKEEIEKLRTDLKMESENLSK